jgi:hypothetical protein
MGFLDSVMGQKKEVKEQKPIIAGAGVSASHGAPFTLSIAFRPLRLAARSDGNVDLIATIHNVSGMPQMCSLVVELPKSLGFDGVGLHKTKELRLGQIGADEAREVAVTIVSSSQTTAGLYRLQATAYAHYRDYTHVLNSVSKTVELRVV